MNRKKLLAFGIGLLTVTTLASYVAIIKPQPISPKTADSSRTPQVNSVKLAIVNEDDGTTYNGESVKISETLINAFTSRVDYSVEVVSRATAENGLANGSYHLMVILPSRFSQDSLALESESPSKSLFQYKIRANEPLLIEQAEQAVLDLKSHFNKDLINIFFLSIINNLQTAQNQVADVVANEESALNSYRSNLIDPLTAYSERFSGLGASPEALLETYNSFDEGLQSTNDAFSSAIDVDRTYEAELEQIRAGQERWQTLLAEREQALSTYNGELSNLTIEEQLTTLASLQENLNAVLVSSEIWDNTIGATSTFGTVTKTLVEDLQGLNSRIDSTLLDYDERIRQAVEESVIASDGRLVNGQPVNETLGLYIKSIDDRVAENINRYLETNFQYYSDEMIEGMNLSSVDKQYLKNINAFIDWHRRLMNRPPKDSALMTRQIDYLNGVKQFVRTELATIQTLSVKDLKGDVGGLAEVIVTIPPAYGLSFTGENGEVVTTVAEGVYTLTAPVTPEGTLSLSYSVIAPADEWLNVLEPVVVTADVKTVETIDQVAPTLDTTTTPSSTEVSASSEPLISEASETVAVTSAEQSITESESVTSIAPATQAPVTVEHHRTVAGVHFPFKDYAAGTAESSAYHDVKNYLELAGMAEAYYDINFNGATQLSSSTITPGQYAISGSDNIGNLKEIIVNLIKGTTVDTLKDNLKVSDEQLAKYEGLQLDSEKLTTDLTNLQTNTSALSEQLNRLIETTAGIDEVLKAKPELLVEGESLDNTDLASVSLDLSNELTKVLAASQVLVESSKSNQGLSDSIKQTMTQLNEDITNLQKDGEDLSSRVSQLRDVMTEEYSSNEEFLKRFSTVLSNTKIGNANNTAVYDYLSNPIDASRIESVLGAATTQTSSAPRRDERSGFLLVIISYLVSLSIAYLMQHTALVRRHVKAAKRVDWQNAMMPMNILTGFSLLSSVFVGWVASNRLTLALPQTFTLVAILMIIILFLTYLTNYLWEKLKGIGFFISIFLFMLYFIVATQLLETYYVTNARILAMVSPLTRLEQLVTNFINQSDGWRLPLMVVLLLTVVFGGLNAFTYRHLKNRGSAG